MIKASKVSIKIAIIAQNQFFYIDNHYIIRYKEDRNNNLIGNP